MKRLAFTSTLIVINILLFGQANGPINEKIFNGPTSKAGKLPHTKLRNYNPYQSRADSIIYYKDTLTNFINYKELYTYDQNKTTLTIQKYNYDKDTLENYKRVEYFYGENIIEMPYEYYRFVCEYTLNDAPYYYENCLGDTMAIRYDWDTLSKQWGLKFKILHQVNSEGLCEKSTTYVWDTSSNQYVFNCFVFQDVVKGDLDTLTLSYCKTEGTGCLSSFQYTYKFNGSNKLYLFDDMIYQDFGYPVTDSLIYDEKGNLTFEYNKLADPYYYQKWAHSYDKYNRIIRTDDIYRDSIDGPWKYFQTLKYFYSYDPITKTNHIDDETFTVYPNPAEDYLFVSGYEGRITITNLLGQVMKHQDIGREGPISLSGMARGFYFITLSNGRTRRFYKN